jgi:hypothetical protein
MSEADHLEEELNPASTLTVLATLAATRVRVESAEWHLHRIVELGEQLTAERTRGRSAADDTDGTAAEARRITDDPAVDAALVTVERARSALEELAKWKGRDSNG